MKQPPSSQTGLSLLELMIAMTLGLMITMTLGYILMGSRSTYRTQDASARVQDTGRFALEFIGRQLRAAGRIDITPLVSDGRTNVTLPTGWTAIAGTHGTAAIGETPAVNGDGAVTINGGTRQTDTLTVQYQLSNMSGGTIVDCNGGTAGALGASLQVINGAGNICGPSANQPCRFGTVSNTIGLDGPDLELQCTGNGGGVVQPVSEGVEDLQFRYAEAATPSVFNATPANPANVVAVQVCIMVQSPGNGVIAAPQPIRDCSGNTYTPNDTRLRRIFTSVFTLRNRVISVP